MTRPTERVFVITGGTKGIGRASAERLIAAGHHPILLARNPPATPIPGATFLPVDLADADATATAAADIHSRFTVDGLVNNVGVVRPAPVDQVTLADLTHVFDLTLRPALQLTQAFLPGMKARGWGRIVNVSSLTILGIAGRTSYAASKAALTSFTRTWALELARTGITVNAVAPGPIETELFRENNPPGSPGEARYLSAVPMARLGQPHEIGAFIAFLLSDDAAYLTGQTLFVDGGASIGKSST